MPGPREETLFLLGRALASVGHELNNLVGVVRSYAAFIEEAATGATAADARVIRASGDKVAVIARQLLAFGHPREHEPELLELGPFLQDVHGFLQRVLGDARRLSLTDGASAGSAVVRRAALGRALLELFLGAHRLVPLRSGLRLAVVREVAPTGAQHVQLSLREERPEGDEASSYEPVSEARLTAAVDWAALALVLAEQGAALNHAWDSVLGLTLSVTFPVEGTEPSSVPALGAEPGRGAVEDEVEERRAAGDAPRVQALVVDDDPHVRLALSRILNDVGADVLTAPTGLHALQKLQAMPIDLVIADQLMPGMEGTRLLETVYKTWPSVVRVVYTGYLSAGLVVDAVNRANVHKLLAKDMAPELLREQLREVVSEIRDRRPT